MAGAHLNCSTYMNMPLYFWKEVLRNVCHSVGAGMLKESAIRQLMDRYLCVCVCVWQCHTIHLHACI